MSVWTWGIINGNSVAQGRYGFYFKSAIFIPVLLIDVFRSSNDNALRWIPRDLIDDKSTLFQVVVWCRQATSHYLSQYPVLHHHMASLGPEEFSHWSADKKAVTLQTTFWNPFSWIKILIPWLKFHWKLFPRVLLTFNNQSALVQIMAWHQTVDQAIIWNNDGLFYIWPHTRWCEGIYMSLAVFVLINKLLPEFLF